MLNGSIFIRKIGAPFDPKKVITLQDPKAEKKNVYDFEYMKKPETVEFGKIGKSLHSSIDGQNQECGAWPDKSEWRT